MDPSRNALLATFLLVLMLLTPCKLAHASGVGISSGPDDLPVTFTPAPFHAYRPGTSAQLRFRDLEFHWDRQYSRDAGASLSAATVNALNLLGAALVDTAANPFNAPYPDFQLIHDYFRKEGSNYNTISAFDTTSVRIGLTAAAGSYPARDRSHVDYYLIKPGHAAGGAYPAAFESALEDTSTGSPVTLHWNSVGYPGPPEGQLDNLAWAAAVSPQVWGFDHEFQHSLPPIQSGRWSTEMVSAAAEAVGGVPHVVAAGDEVAYTASLLADPGGDGAACGSPATTLDINYSGRRLFASYLAYNFRGADTTAARPLIPTDTIGFGDDLLWRWARSEFRRIEDLKLLLPVNAAYFSRIDPLAGPTTTLGAVDLMCLLHHNWRVANYLNAPQIADGRYGYPPQFGFSPSVDVGAWQAIGSCAANRLVAIPPKVSLAFDPTRRSVTSVGSRRSDDGIYSHPMVLQPYGAEYWIARSGSMNNSYNRQLIVTVSAENADPQCGGSGRLVASVATYRDQADSLWRHPEWVQDVLPPLWADVDSLPGELQFVVPDFGNPLAASPRLAAVTTISLGERTSNLGANGVGQPLIQRTQYRVSHELAAGPYSQPFTAALPSKLTLVANSGKDDLSPGWAPQGGEITYSSTLGGSVAQIYRRAFAAGNLNQAQVLVHAVPARNQFRPDWSPRGDWIAFDQDSVAGTSDLYMKNVLTSELRRLSSGTESEFNASFQPNGQGLAYVKRIGIGASRRFELRWMNLTSTTDIVVLGPGNSSAIGVPRWEVDGSKLYFTRADSLYSVQLPGGQVSALASPLGDAKSTSLDVPRGAGAFVVEQPGAFSDTCLSGLIVETENFRRLVVKTTTSGGQAFARFYQRGRQFYGPRISLDGTRAAYGVTENPNGLRDINVGILSYDHPPTMSSAAIDVTLQPGIPFSLNLATGASDPDGDPIYYKAAYLPPNATFTGSTFAWSNPQAIPGGGNAHFVVFVAFDSAGAQDYRVVRYEIADTGGGCPFAEVLTGSGWSEGNSVAQRSATLALVVDAYRLPEAPILRGGRYSLRIRENEAEESSIDGVAMLVVDRDPALRTFAAGERILQGQAHGPTRVTNARGEDVTALFVGSEARGMLADPGEVLLVEFESRPTAQTMGIQSAPGAPRTSDEGGGFYLESGGKEIPPEIRVRPPVELASAGPDERTLSLTGVDLQIPDGEGGWRTVLRHYPRARLDFSAFDAIPVGPVRLVFAGRHQVRSLGRIVSDATALSPVQIAPTIAHHSRLGNVRGAVAAAGTEATTLVHGDTLELAFEAPALLDGMGRDFYLVTRGAYRSATSATAAGNPAGVVGAPLEFSLGAARPNPSRGGATIPFALPVASTIHLRIFDATGRLVRTLIHGVQTAGTHEVEWNRRSDAGVRVTAGIYFYQLVIPGREATKRVVLLGE